MSSTETLIRNEIEKDELRIQRAVERGGLPSESEIASVYRALRSATEMLEPITWRAEGIARSDMGDDIPEITLEQLGVLTLLIDDVERESEFLARFAERLRTSVSSLNAIRSQQQHDREDHSA